jgi:Protein of unknown function (DUF2914)
MQAQPVCATYHHVTNNQSSFAEGFIMKITHLIAGALLLIAGSAQADIARAVFTTAIEGREPVDQITQLGNDKTGVYFFTEITGMNGHSITHRWEFGGEPRFEMTFSVGADRWRVWSNKTLTPGATGEWKVVVVDESGFVLRTEVLNYVAADAAAPAEATPPAPPAAPSVQ